MKDDKTFFFDSIIRNPGGKYVFPCNFGRALADRRNLFYDNIMLDDNDSVRTGACIASFLERTQVARSSHATAHGLIKYWYYTVFYLFPSRQDRKEKKRERRDLDFEKSPIYTRIYRNDNTLFSTHNLYMASGWPFHRPGM